MCFPSLRTTVSNRCTKSLFVVLSVGIWGCHAAALFCLYPGSIVYVSSKKEAQSKRSSQHLEMKKIWWWERDILRGASEGIVSPLWWCYQWQLREGGARFELLGRPTGSQKPSAETHLLHMSILPLNPSKGFPESSSPSIGPQLFEVLILCVFVALKSLSYGHVMSYF